MNSQEVLKAGSQLLVEIIEAETIVYHQETRQIHESVIYEAQPSNQRPARTRIEKRPRAGGVGAIASAARRAKTG